MYMCAHAGGYIRWTLPCSLSHLIPFKTGSFHQAQSRLIKALFPSLLWGSVSLLLDTGLSVGCIAHLVLLWVGNSNLFFVCTAAVLTAEPFPQPTHVCFKVG